jgi:hypothetical protein
MQLNVDLIENIKLFIPVRLGIKRKYDLNDLESNVLALIESIIQLATNSKTCYCGYSDESLGEIIGKSRDSIKRSIKTLKEKDLIVITNAGSKNRKIYLNDYLRTEEEKGISKTDTGQAYLKTIEKLQQTIAEQQEQIKKLNMILEQQAYIPRANQFTQMLIDYGYLNKKEMQDGFMINEYNVLLTGLTHEIDANSLKKILHYILVKRKEQANRIKINDKFKWLDSSIRSNYKKLNKPIVQMSWHIGNNEIIEEEIPNLSDNDSIDISE